MFSSTEDKPSSDELSKLKVQARIELDKLEAQSSAKEVAGKSIGKQGLFYITLIVVLGVGASVVLENEKIAAVMGLLGASLTALISMLNGIAGASPKQEKPEFQVINELINKLEKAAAKEPMRIDVDGEKVTVTKGDDTFESRKGA
jgi:hypothetical protein